VAKTLTPDQLVQATYAVVLAGGRGARLQQLTYGCAKPAVPFAGQLKIIDFTLNNCFNSGIRRVSVLTQYQAQSLHRHIEADWGFLNAERGEFVNVVAARHDNGHGGYRGTADAVYQNLARLRQAKARFVLVLAGDHIYKMDYRRIIAEHAQRNADVSVACIEVPVAQASAFGVMQVDANGRIREFEEKPSHPCAIPGRPGVALASMGIYVFNADYLYQALRHDQSEPASCRDFGRDIIPGSIKRARLFAHDFSQSCVNRVSTLPYWRDVGTLDAYWQANMDLAQAAPELDLYDQSWPMRGMPRPLPPVDVVCDEAGFCGMAINSLFTSGCIVSGATVQRSMLFSRARVGRGSVVEDSLLLPHAVVGRHVVLRRAIIDSHCVLPDGIQIGVDPTHDRSRFTVSANGVTLVTAAMLGQAA
jgi:glucose-1-phosphate adenylyltransferase